MTPRKILPNPQMPNRAYLSHGRDRQGPPSQTFLPQKTPFQDVFRKARPRFMPKMKQKGNAFHLTGSDTSACRGNR
jgi:hypothetical protein